jgi:alpha-galactosidase
MTFTVSGLPASLTLDVANGVISGTAPSASVYPLRITAANSLGSDTLTVELVIGDALALTPPMGWNTYNAFRMRIDDPLIRLQADAMVSTGLINYGYSYINIDDGWQGQRTPDGSIQGNTRFPDMPALGAYLHAKGLKFGLYSSPGPRTCADYEGSYGHEVQDARTYATWGVDFIKYDWCSYDAIAQNLAAEKYAALLPQHANRIRAIVAERIPLTASRIRPRPPEQSARIRELTDELNALSAAISPEQRAQITREIHVHPYRVFGQALAAVDRDIIYSLCQYGMEDPGEWAPAIGGHLWRTTRDITPNRRAIERITQQQVGHEKHAAPGRWNDPDMLEIGNGTLTPDEMHSHMTQWCILAAPLLIGTDLTKIDPLTFSILANHEILAVNQDPLGTQGRRVRQTGNADIWTKPLADGTLAVALFNRGDSPLTITVPMADLKLPAGGSTGVPAPHPIRDLWRHKDLPAATTVTADVAPYSAELFKVGHPTTKSDR